MTNYVLVYGKTPDGKVVIVSKKRGPSHLIGKLNLPGGKVEPGETPDQAACREWKEETGCVTGTIWQGVFYHASGAKVYVFRALAQSKVVTKVNDVGEKIHLMTLRSLLCHPDLMENLKIIIPLCEAGVFNWSLECNDRIPYVLSFEEPKR